MLILDTDLLTLLERGGSASLPLQLRLDRFPDEAVVTTVITYEEQSRGWLSRVAAASTIEEMVSAYANLSRHIQTFQTITILPLDAPAVARFQELRRARVRIGTMDLKIAAIALANDATLLTRNLKDFGQVSGLRAEDWSA